VIKVLVDVNVFMDVFQVRDGAESSSEALSIVEEQDKRNNFVSALTIPILYYLLSQKIGGFSARQKIKELLDNYTIVELTGELIKKAIDDEKMSDFEDCIQYLSAKTNFCDAIITRNVKDFKKADINVYTPEDFLSIII
jgi:predicted nucleic acid-binding protein